MPANKKRVPLGAPLDLSDELLDELTTAEAIAPADELEKQELILQWKTAVRDLWKMLLEAIQEEPDA